MTEQEKNDLLTNHVPKIAIKQAAKKFGVHVSTVYRMRNLALKDPKGIRHFLLKKAIAHKKVSEANEKILDNFLREPILKSQPTQ